MVQLVKLLSVLQQVQSVWSLVAGEVVEDRTLAGTPVYAYDATVRWFQSTFAQYDTVQNVPNNKTEPIGRIGSSFYRSNKYVGNGQIYTSVNITRDWMLQGVNYKGQTIYVLSSEAGVSKDTRTQSDSNNMLLYAFMAFSAIMLFSDNKK